MVAYCMKVTAEMVEAACIAYWESNRLSHIDRCNMRAALTAAMAVQPVSEQAQSIDALLMPVQRHLQDALRIPTTPWPDAAAHGHEATGRAIHAAYCALRFKVIDAFAALTAARCGVADADPLDAAAGRAER